MYAYGMKVAAVSLLCQDELVSWDSHDSMQGLRALHVVPWRFEAAQYWDWDSNPNQKPEGSRYKPQKTHANKPELW